MNVWRPSGSAGNPLLVVAAVLILAIAGYAAVQVREIAGVARWREAEENAQRERERDAELEAHRRLTEELDQLAFERASKMVRAAKLAISEGKDADAKRLLDAVVSESPNSIPGGEARQLLKERDEALAVRRAEIEAHEKAHAIADDGLPGAEKELARAKSVLAPLERMRYPDGSIVPGYEKEYEAALKRYEIARKRVSVLKAEEAGR